MKDKKKTLKLLLIIFIEEKETKNECFLRSKLNGYDN